VFLTVQRGKMKEEKATKDNSNLTTYLIESFLSMIGNSGLWVERWLKSLKYKWIKRGYTSRG